MAAVAAAGPIRIQVMTRDGVRAPGDPPEGTTDYLDVREGLTGSPMVAVDGTQRWANRTAPDRGRHRPHGSVVTVNPGSRVWRPWCLWRSAQAGMPE
jgi:hypothetical protein